MSTSWELKLDKKRNVLTLNSWIQNISTFSEGMLYVLYRDIFHSQKKELPNYQLNLILDPLHKWG